MNHLNFHRKLILVTLTLGASVAHAQTLLGSFTWSDNGHLYELYSSAGIGYNDAAAFATGKGGYLATIVSADEKDAVTSALGGLVPFTAYLGGSQPVNETDPNGSWSWTTGETWSYTNWGPGEPNDFNGPASEQFLQMYSDGTWNDIGENISGYNQGFMVETVPEPSIAATALGLLGLLARRKSRPA